MKKKTIIAVILIVLFIAIGLFGFYNTPYYSDFLKNRVEKQLEEIYGISFEVTEIDEGRAGIPDTDDVLSFRGSSEDGILTMGTCDWNGTLLSEAYIHYYYAQALNDDLKSILGDTFDDCFVVRDVSFHGSKAATDLVKVNSVSDAKAYKELVEWDVTYFLVYVKEPVREWRTDEAIDRLRENHYQGNVYFIQLQADLFEELKASKIACYYPLSSTSERIAKYVTCADLREIDNLIADPIGHSIAEYVPKWD